MSYVCATCGSLHPEAAMAWHSEAPHYLSEASADDPDSVLDTDLCVIGNSAYFMRGLIELPVEGLDEPFAWGVWVSLSEATFGLVCDTWEPPIRAEEEPFFGWLSSELTVYEPSTINLRTRVHTRPPGLRPLIELEPSDHPLSIEQRMGITPDRVRQIAELLTHQA